MDKEKSGGWLDRIIHLLGDAPKEASEQHKRRNRLRSLRQFAHEQQVSSGSLVMIEGVLRLEHLRVRDVMIPRAQMVTIDNDADTQSILHTVVNSGHSRFPVLDANGNEVIGLLLAKDLLRSIDTLSINNGQTFSINDYLRKPLLVPESTRLNELMRLFQQMRGHMAIVHDELSTIAGLVTLEDIFEEIVGDITDEFDVQKSAPILLCADGSHQIDATTDIKTFNKRFSTHYNSVHFDTIGGLILSRLGAIPNEGDVVTIDSMRFRILKADNRRIATLSLLPPDTQ